VVSTRRFLLGALAGAVTLFSAASLSAQARAATICKDGTTSVSAGRGACSGHGGVDRKAVSHQKKVVKRETKGRAVAPTPLRVTAPTPRASVRARERASTNSAVATGTVAREDNNPSGAIARCKDGLYSHAANRRGACSRHGGVASWL